LALSLRCADADRLWRVLMVIVVAMMLGRRCRRYPPIYRTDRPTHWQVGQARMSAIRFCEPVRKLRRPGEPWLWRLK
jgi:hypothetical protein